MCSVDVVDADCGHAADWDFVLENMNELQKIATTFVWKYPYMRVYYGYDDFLHEGIIKAKQEAHLFDRTRGCSAAYINTIVGRHIFKMLNRAKRMYQREGVYRYGVDGLCFIESEEKEKKRHYVQPTSPVYANGFRDDYSHISPRVEQRRWLEFSDLQINISLTCDTFAFCKCLLDPPEELRILLSNQLASKAPWKNSIEKLICNRLAIPNRRFPVIAMEIRERCELVS